ncbi:hypothetical protein [Legionella fallonii]|uniref:Transmembrane protein n=1 Tax=Legionella fallonii LLAP-10 TaxID=1212491 RepID=A0A098G662_9GAMM|nr:hypothetical protein [Legionella fallonii]CEG56995.1 conserved membrane protein of unknown function [Legionella fallonii LLAP-10]
MEPDRYESNNKLYILGIICLISALSLFFFSLYIAPFLIWHLNYEVPGIVTILAANFEQQYNMSEGQANTLVWFIFFIPSLITGYIAYYVSNRIDNQIYKVGDAGKEQERKNIPPPVTRDISESAGLAFKIIFLMVAIVAIILLLQLLVQI